MLFQNTKLERVNWIVSFKQSEFITNYTYQIMPKRQCVSCLYIGAYVCRCIFAEFYIYTLQVIEFVQFKERLQHSNQYLVARVEAPILQLKQNADKIEEEEVINCFVT